MNINSVSEDETTAYMLRLSEKQFATPEDLAMYQVLDGQHVIQVEGMAFRLEADNVPDKLDAKEQEEASSHIPHWNDETNQPDLEECADVVDRTSLQVAPH